MEDPASWGWPALPPPAPLVMLMASSSTQQAPAASTQRAPAVSEAWQVCRNEYAEQAVSPGWQANGGVVPDMAQVQVPGVMAKDQSRVCSYCGTPSQRECVDADKLGVASYGVQATRFCSWDCCRDYVGAVLDALQRSHLCTAVGMELQARWARAISEQDLERQRVALVDDDTSAMEGGGGGGGGGGGRGGDHPTDGRRLGDTTAAVVPLKEQNPIGLYESIYVLESILAEREAVALFSYDAPTSNAPIGVFRLSNLPPTMTGAALSAFLSTVGIDVAQVVKPARWGNEEVACSTDAIVTVVRDPRSAQRLAALHGGKLADRTLQIRALNREGRFTDLVADAPGQPVAIPFARLVMQKMPAPIATRTLELLPDPDSMQ